ncbi:UDP-N-acetylmuramoyl-tripeptide--D-alanyl-D-alanine ligase [Immundisolibacter sp.]|uniref:UDP-N-acetylmuramoyl-tripeptide--D-alanyl-D- alanine ligase n=1 Tax=Immundisolibacter sp. TaxID=1934948 RepID=UPI0026385398|nr:UDP-N-acetylmuramoyl-tripeptide--D-alanyl-D-alanine ligase [Immundisolibacter sp.]MDD3650765.1 UDP-N-acetylmuramoyl-tripeptide--D-alanyl-D-alanine ligase [Immundisolibacter sp.]
MMTLAEAARLIGAHQQPAGHFTGVGTDSRTLAAGELFVALAGPRFDGHDYLPAVAAAGAAGAVVRRPHPALPCLVVADPLAALGRLAAAWRGRFTLPLLAVTGSSGKTTIKELLAAALAGLGPVLATRGNRNNHIGVPLTLLELRPAHRAAVIEMGMNHPGEIAHLAALAGPTVGVIGNAGAAHLEGLGSVAAVARAKGELIERLPADAVAVLNADDAHLPLWRELAGARRVISFGLDQPADVTAEYTLSADGSALELRTPAGSIATRLALLGRHNVLNALAATAAALAAGADLADIAKGLATVRPVPGRLYPLTGQAGARLIDDSYNANPLSVRAAIEVLAGLPGERLLVLGDMRELGADAARLHADCGAAARAAGIEHLVTLGPLATHAASAFGAGAVACTELAQVIDAAGALLQPDLIALIKGSRSAGMERVVQALAAGDSPHGGH